MSRALIIGAGGVAGVVGISAVKILKSFQIL